MRPTRDRIGYFVVGVGTGALADGFVFHQLLQWHHLWSRRIPDTSLARLKDNTFADGIFHTTFLVVLLFGIGLMIGRRLEPRPLVGLLLVGWGVFHILDQLIFHLALRAHHIREGVENPEVYNWSFFGIGLVLVAVGGVILRRATGPVT